MSGLVDASGKPLTAEPEAPAADGPMSDREKAKWIEACARVGHDISLLVECLGDISCNETREFLESTIRRLGIAGSVEAAMLGHDKPKPETEEEAGP